MSTYLKLSPRLEAVVDLCDKSKIIADIGCDHGLVTGELILQEKAEKVVATDYSEKCLNKAIVLAHKLNITSFVSFRVGNGFEAVTKYDKINLAVIAGMGGDEIIRILVDKPKKLFNFVFQPMKDVVKLRQYLLAHKFKIVEDKLIKEGDKYYNIIKTTKGKMHLSELEIYFGKDNFTSNAKLFYDYLVGEKQRLDAIRERMGELNSHYQNHENYVLQALKIFSMTDKTEK